MAPQKLRDLIRSIRACKTAAEERDVVNKECALIRTSFRAEDNEYRCRNVAKLLYIHMLGYPAHFGQLECLKLVASPRFSDKRIGYLGTMMLLDELKDVSLLVTNSLKNDLNHQVQYVAGLALSCLGAICSAEMAQDLAPEISKLLKSTNSYVRKKAVLCALRIIRRVPELIETFLPATRALLGERNHGVLITGVTLISEIVVMTPENIPPFRKLVPSLVRILKNLIVSGYSPEHDVGGVTDPFLQVGILRLLRLLGKGDPESLEAMNDTLAQVATNTDSNKNVGNAILYETVHCILNLTAETGLRVMAVNILGKFLSNSDRNIRFVALTTLLHMLQTSESSESVQRHRATVLECLKDPDSSIRKRALSLAFALITEINVKSMVKELLIFLETADPELKGTTTRELVKAADRFAPTRRWHLDTLLQVFTCGSNYVSMEDVYSTIVLVANSPELCPYMVQQLYTALQTDQSSQPLVQLATWCIGEYGQHLQGPAADPDRPFAATPSAVLDLLRSILDSTLSSLATRDMALTAVMKLSTRFPSHIDRIRTMVGQYNNNVEVELQQRSSEYTSIFNLYNTLRPALLEQMPVSELKATTARGPLGSLSSGGATASAPAAAAAAPSAGAASGMAAPKAAEPSLLDLLDMGPSAPTPAPAAPSAAAGNMLDLLGLGGPVFAPTPMPAPTHASAPQASLLDLMGLGPAPQSYPAPAPAPTSAPSNGGLLDLMGGLGLGASTPAPAMGMGGPFGGGAMETTMTVFEKDGLQITFTLSKPPGGNLNLLVTSLNTSAAPLHNFVFQAAVPKSLQLQLQAQSSATVPPLGSGRVTQAITVVNPTQAPVRMRLKITYTLQGAPISHTCEVNNIPPQFV